MSTQLKFIILFLFLILNFSLVHAQNPAYGTYGLFPTGSTRTLAMGGAFVCLADDATSVIYNPAGLALSRWRFDLQSSTNRVVNREGDLNLDGEKEGIPYNFNYTAAATRIGFLGLGFGYSVPYDVIEDFGGLSTSKQKIRIESLDLAVSFRLSKSLSIGVTCHKEMASMSFSDSSLNELAEDQKELIYPQLGMVFRPERKWGMGIVYSPERRYDIDSNLNETLSGTYNWFQDIVIPPKLSLGLSLMLKSRLNLVGDIDIYYPSENTYLVGNDNFNTGNKIVENELTVWHGGFEFEVISKKDIEFIWRGGGYQEPSRLLNSKPRFHFTMGIEIRFGFIKLSAAYDQAKDFTSYSQSIGLSISDLR
ncbi:MAG: hypothetical protein H6625_14050 [Bdellovibrionaceae bacterium]|nr:hypothetical protein [Pseudobdellovibrionaceae bacterium]